MPSLFSRNAVAPQPADATGLTPERRQAMQDLHWLAESGSAFSPPRWVKECNTMVRISRLLASHLRCLSVWRKTLARLAASAASTSMNAEISTTRKLNDTNVANCTFVAGTVPPSLAFAADGSKTASMWLRDAAGNVSTRVDSNTIVLDRDPGDISTIEDPGSVDEAREAIEASFRTAIVRTRVRAVMTFVTFVAVFGGITFVVWMGARSVLAGQMTYGELAQFLLYAMFTATSAGTPGSSSSARPLAT